MLDLNFFEVNNNFTNTMIFFFFFFSDISKQNWFWHNRTIITIIISSQIWILNTYKFKKILVKDRGCLPLAINKSCNPLYFFFSQFTNLILNQFYSRQNISIGINNTIYSTTNLFTKLCVCSPSPEHSPNNLLCLSKILHLSC